MATMEERLLELVLSVGTDYKTTRTFVTNLTGNLANLSTSQKGSIVAALNEVYAMAQAAAGTGGGATINDATPTGTTTYSSNKINQVVAALVNDLATATNTTWSSTKINAAINTAVANLVGGAPGTLDTLKELADALGDAGAITAINLALSKRVRFDIANQGLTVQEQLNARTNIGAVGTLEIGNTNVDLVAAYTAAKA